FEEINKHPAKYGQEIDSTTRQKWIANKNVDHPPPLCFVQAYANKFKVNVHMFFGLPDPIIFKSDRPSVPECNILIQNIANVHFNPLTLALDEIPEEDIPNFYSKFNQSSQSWQDISDQFSWISDHEIEINQNLDYKPIIKLESSVDERRDSEAINQVLNQNSEGSFEAVHPLSYEGWYSKPCTHQMSTDCFVPVRVNGRSFCSCIDTGTSCSIMSMSIADELYKSNKLIKIKDQRIRLLGAGGLTKVFDTRIVATDFSIGTGEFRNMQFMLVPDSLMHSCFVIGTDILNLEGISIDFGSRLLLYKNKIIIELGRLKHPVFYNNKSEPPINKNNIVEDIFKMPEIQVNREKIVKNKKEKNSYFKATKSQQVSEDQVEVPLQLDNFISEQDILDLQKTDSEIKKLFKIMSYPDYVLPPYLSKYSKAKPYLKIINDIIYFHKPPYDPVPILPTNSIITIALMVHDTYMHVGRERLVDLVKKIAYHVNLSDLMGRLSSSCPVCLLRKTKAPTHTAPIIKIQTHYPFQMIEGDLIHMPQSSHFKYILTVQDHFSKFSAAWPLKTKTSQEVADTFEQHILPTLFIHPHIFFSDKGGEFQSGPFKQMLSTYNIKQINSVSHNPRSHGLIERWNRSLLQSLRAHADISDDWPSAIRQAVHTYNNTKHSTLGMSPIEFIITKQHTVHKKPILDYKETQFWRVGHPGFKSFQKGALVMKVVPRIGDRCSYKLQNLYSGPFKVLDIFKGGLTYEIQSLDDMGIISRIHHNQLRSWVFPDKVLLKNPEFLAFYNATRPMTPLEEHMFSAEYDPVEHRDFSFCWRPADEDWEIDQTAFQSEENDGSERGDTASQDNIHENRDNTDEDTDVDYTPSSYFIPPLYPLPQHLIHNHNNFTYNTQGADEAFEVNSTVQQMPNLNHLNPKDPIIDNNYVGTLSFGNPTIQNTLKNKDSVTCSELVNLTNNNEHQNISPVHSIHPNISAHKNLFHHNLQSSEHKSQIASPCHNNHPLITPTNNKHDDFYATLLTEEPESQVEDSASPLEFISPHSDINIISLEKNQASTSRLLLSPDSINEKENISEIHENNILVVSPEDIISLQENNVSPILDLPKTNQVLNSLPPKYSTFPIHRPMTRSMTRQSNGQISLQKPLP
ncbi:unnamed protein product, partial [Rotaria magnacalcarata]